jgi:hypothetical protein
MVPPKVVEIQRYRLAQLFPISSAEISRDSIIKLLKSPGIDFKESIPPAYVLCSLTGRYDNPHPTRFQALHRLL